MFKEYYLLDKGYKHGGDKRPFGKCDVTQKVY